MSIYLLSPSPAKGCLSLPMIRFEPMVESIDLRGYEGLLFTSKQAVKSIDRIAPTWKEIPSFAIGPSTAKMIESLGGIVVYQAKLFYGASVAKEISARCKNKKMLYLRPKEVAFDLKEALSKQGVHLEEKVLYKTSCIPYETSDKPRKNAIIIFTSPSTIACFLKQFFWDKSYIAVVIGQTTKKHLPKEAYYKVADEPTIESCIAKAKEILLSSNPK